MKAYIFLIPKKVLKTIVVFAWAALEVKQAKGFVVLMPFTLMYVQSRDLDFTDYLVPGKQKLSLSFLPINSLSSLGSVQTACKTMCELK